MPTPNPLARVAADLRGDAAAGVALIVASVVALVWANVAPASYHDLWTTTLSLPGPAHPLTLEAWVNEGLMAIFFFVVGLEIKREIVAGELRDPRAAMVPIAAALGGMIVPAALFALVTVGSGLGNGWGIPMATDIAFAVGVLRLVARRAPPSLGVTLLTLAIVDDVGAILVIAVFYSAGISFGVAARRPRTARAHPPRRPHARPPPLVSSCPRVVLWVEMLRSGDPRDPRRRACSASPPRWSPATAGRCSRRSSTPSSRGATSWSSRCSRSPTSGSRCRRRRVQRRGHQPGGDRDRGRPRWSGSSSGSTSAIRVAERLGGRRAGRPHRPRRSSRSGCSAGSA